jgi:hypothetical protein
MNYLTQLNIIPSASIGAKSFPGDPLKYPYTPHPIIAKMKAVNSKQQSTSVQLLFSSGPFSNSKGDL